MSRRRVASTIAAGLIIGGTLLAAAAPVAAHSPANRSQVKVLLDELSSPKGIVMGGKTSVVVSQGAYGPPPGPVLAYFVKGSQRGTTEEITDPLNLVDITLTPDGAGWGIGGDLVLYRQSPVDGTISPVLDIQAYQTSDPDPVNSPTEPADESNPFGLAALPNSDVLLADAAGNDVIRVSPNGDAHTVARWSRQMASGISVEAVPTSIAIGRDGWAYVGQLVGVPGPRARAHLAAQPERRGPCHVRGRQEDRRLPRLEAGFTGIMDLAWDTHNRTLYVYEIAKGGFLPSKRASPDRRVPEGGPPPGQGNGIRARSPRAALAAGRRRRRQGWRGLRDRRHVHRRTAYPGSERQPLT